MEFFYLALCAYLFMNHLLHLFAYFSCPIAPVEICAPHSVTGSLEVLAHGLGAMNFVLVRAQCYLKVTPRAQPLLGGVQSSQHA
jgi:hypothetical protein